MFCILLCIETIRNRFLRGVLIVLLIFGSLFCDWALLAPVFTLLFRWSGQDQNDCGSVLRFLPRCLAG